MVLFKIAVGVFNGDFGFAYAPKSADYLDWMGGSVLKEIVPQAGQGFFPACKVAVPAPGQIFNRGLIFPVGFIEFFTLVILL